MHKKFNLQKLRFNFCLTKNDLQQLLSNFQLVWVNLHKIDLRALDASDGQQGKAPEPEIMEM